MCSGRGEREGGRDGVSGPDPRGPAQPLARSPGCALRHHCSNLTALGGVSPVCCCVWMVKSFSISEFFNSCPRAAFSPQKAFD